eukprot:1034354-Heterocapsa_arctica.AAC.1
MSPTPGIVHASIALLLAQHCAVPCPRDPVPASLAPGHTVELWVVALKIQVCPSAGEAWLRARHGL